MLRRSFVAGTSHLVAYVTPDLIDQDEVIRELSQMVPEYMVPEVMVPMAALPSLPNGKILEKQAVNVNDPVRGQKIAMLGMLDQHAPRTRRRRPHTYCTPRSPLPSLERIFAR